MTHPKEGGSYRREKDRSLTRVTFTGTDKPAIETSAPAPAASPAEAPTIVETPAEEETGGKKGKS